MVILLTGANGYIGLRLLPQLLEAGHIVHAVVRDRRRLPMRDFEAYADRLHVVEAELTEEDGCRDFPKEIDVAYFLVHAMGSGGAFEEREAQSAENFRRAVEQGSCKQIIYLGGILPHHRKLSRHLASRKRVEEILVAGRVPVTAMRASIILGSGSASFEIVRDLVEKLPVLITPRWTRNKCQPIAIRNVTAYLMGAAGREDMYDRSFDIGGPEKITYRDLLRCYAEARGLKRTIITTPMLSLRLSSYWLFFMTSTSYPIARALVDSMAYDSVSQNDDIRALIPQQLLTCREAIDKAFARIAQNRVPSSWSSALGSGRLSPARLKVVHVPEHGVMRDKQALPLQASREEVIRAVWSLGGATGWPSMNWAWKLRGSLDRLTGGIGVRRGRRDPEALHEGDAVDFWRVLLADRTEGRLILYAEMNLPGEAWLEFDVREAELRQTATFRPLGLWGRLYWILCLPFHFFLFPKMARRLVAPHARKALC